MGGRGFQDEAGCSQIPQFVNVWITRDSNRPIQASLERGDGGFGEVTKTSDAGLEVYRLAAGDDGAHAKHGTCVAFPTEHVAVLAGAPDDVIHVAKSLSANNEDIPARWKKAAAALNLEAPVVLLREFGGREQCIFTDDPDNPHRLRREPVAIDSFGMTSNAGPKVTFKLRAITPQAAEAEIYFYGGTFYAGFAPGYWEWTRTTDAEGLTAEVAFVKAGQAHHCSLVVIALFGMLLGI